MAQVRRIKHNKHEGAHKLIIPIQQATNGQKSYHRTENQPSE